MRDLIVDVAKAALIAVCSATVLVVMFATANLLLGRAAI